MPLPRDAKPNVPGVQTVKRTNRFLYALQIGIFAGLIFGAIRWICHYFRFTGVIPGFLVEPFFLRSFLAGNGGHVVGTAAFIVLSVAASLLYAPIASKLRGPWPGALYGALWFCVLYLWIGPMLGMLLPLGKLSWDSFWTDGSIFVMWGVFIGYSISYEFTNERRRDKQMPLPSMKH